VDDVMFSDNGQYGMCHWNYLYEYRAGASSHKFPTYSPGRATVFFILIYFRLTPIQNNKKNSKRKRWTDNDRQKLYRENYTFIDKHTTLHVTLYK